MDNQIIFDIGFHKGEDTAYYLQRGYKVIAVDAVEKLLFQGAQKFENAISNKMLILHQALISSEKKENVPFYESPNSQWNSANKDIAERNGMKAKKTLMSSITIDDLIDQYGTPYYCKIDIEGNDILALRGITKRKPQFISVESECFGDHEDSETVTFLTLDALRDMGYTRFKLVDQSTLTVLNEKPFYVREKNFSFKYIDNFMYAKQIFGVKNFKYCFSQLFPGSSGPFGKDLRGKWFTYNQAKNILKLHKQQQQQLGFVKWSFWCDWHATF